MSHKVRATGQRQWTRPRFLPRRRTCSPCGLPLSIQINFQEDFVVLFVLIWFKKLSAQPLNSKFQYTNWTGRQTNRRTDRHYFRVASKTSCWQLGININMSYTLQRHMSSYQQESASNSAHVSWPGERRGEWATRLISFGSVCLVAFPMYQHQQPLHCPTWLSSSPSYQGRQHQ